MGALSDNEDGKAAIRSAIIISAPKKTKMNKETPATETAKDTTTRSTTISAEEQEAWAALEREHPRPPWALKDGTVVVSVALSKPSTTEK